MTDLSDIIGSAVGGHEGKLIDEMIDKLRIVTETLTGMTWTDTEIVQAVLYRIIETHEYKNLVVVDDNDMVNAVTTLDMEISDLKIAGYRMEE